MIRLLIASLMCCAPFAAGAQASAVAITTDTNQVQAQTGAMQAGADQARADQVSADQPGETQAGLPNERNCLRQTGSRITARYNAQAQRDKTAEKCAPVMGRSYDRADLQRTGAVDMADALRLLDPSIR